MSNVFSTDVFRLKVKHTKSEERNKQDTGLD